MTRRVGFVSAWIGRFAGEDALFDYVQKTYPADQPATSAFLTDFPIGFYDEDFSEANFIVDVDDLDAALAGHSYIDSFVAPLRADLQRVADFNSIYLIYDFDASDTSPHVTARMRWLGTYAYVRT